MDDPKSPTTTLVDPIYKSFSDALDTYTSVVLRKVLPDSGLTQEHLEIAARDLVSVVTVEFERLRRMQMLGVLAVATLSQGPLEAKLIGSLIQAEIDKAKKDGSLIPAQVKS